MIKIIIGIALCALGILAGIGLGIGWGFIGGLALAISQFTGTFSPALFAFGVARVVFSVMIGWISFMVFFLPGWVILADS